MSDVRRIDCGSREAWLVERAKSIGSSDAAAIVGASPFRTALEVYLEKTAPNEALVETEEMEWGHELEEPIARVFGRRTGMKVTEVPPHALYRRDDAIHLHASPDRFLVGRPGGDGMGVLEIKTTSGRNADEWDDDVPLHYQVQVQHQLLVLRLQWAYVTVLIGGQRMRSFEVEADPLFHEALAAQARMFWRRVEDRDPPEPSPDRDYDAVKRLFRKSVTGKRVALEQRLFDEWMSTREARLAAEKTEKAAATRLMAALGDAEFGDCPDGHAVKWAFELAEVEAKEAHTVEKRVLRPIKAAANRRGAK